MTSDAHDRRTVDEAKHEASPARPVFISYAHDDQDVAEAVCSALEREGLPCWIAPRNVPPGSKWQDAILQGVAGSRIVVLIFSSRSNVSEPVQNEVERARAKGRDIIPFRIENTPPTGGLEFELSRAHWLEAWIPPFEDRLAELVGAVRYLLRSSGPGAATRLWVPSRPVEASLRRVAVRNALLFAVLGLLLLKVSPFGFEPVASRLSQDLPNQIFGSRYPDAARAQLATVLLMDDDLPDDEGWPVRYGLHARVLRRLGELRPRAIMIDIIFRYARDDDSLPELLAALRDLQREGVPVFAASASLDEDGDLLPGLAGLVRPVPVPKITDLHDRRHRAYDLVALQWMRPVPTAAMALYNEVQRPQPWSPDELRQSFAHPLHVVWGTTPVENYRHWLACTPAPTNVGSAAIARLFGEHDAWQTDCPHTATFFVGSLLDPEESPTVAAVVRDRIVFYGLSLVGASDVVFPPTHSRLPGVYLHTMALDNLITYGERYIRLPRPGSALERLTWLFELGMFSLYAGVFTVRDAVDARLRARRTPYAEVRRRRIRWTAWGECATLAVGLVASLGLVALVTAAVRIAPVNWLGVFTIAALLMLVRGWEQARR